jgi:hypothetical protein
MTKEFTSQISEWAEKYQNDPTSLEDLLAKCYVAVDTGMATGEELAPVVGTIFNYLSLHVDSK